MGAAVSANAGTDYAVKWSLAAGTLTATIDSATGVVYALAAGSASVTACATASVPNARSQPVCGEAAIMIVSQITDVAAHGVAFVRNGTIFVSRPDGSDPAALAAGATRPAWSPDGARLAFTRPFTAWPSWQLCTIRSDGSDIRCATGAADGQVVGPPSWSPDGTLVAFSVCTSPCGNLESISGALVLRAATMKVESLNTPPAFSVSWSPDGRKIALALANIGTLGRGALATVSPDGSGLEILAMSLGRYSVRELAWSPDSRRLALQLNDEYNCPWECDTAIGVVSADGTNLKLLDTAKTSEHAAIWGTPAWSPDGASVAYTIGRRDTCLNENEFCGTYVGVARVEDGAKMLLIPEAAFPSWRR